MEKARRLETPGASTLLDNRAGQAVSSLSRGLGNIVIRSRMDHQGPASDAGITPVERHEGVEDGAAQYAIRRDILIWHIPRVGPVSVR